MQEKIDYQNSFGLQLDDSGLRLAQIKKKGKRLKIVSYSQRELAPGVMEKGVVKQHKALAETIRRAKETAAGRSIKSEKVICSVPENKSFVKIIEMPVMKEAELGEAVKWETEDNIPLPLEKVYFDWQILGKGSKGKLRIMLVAAPREIIDSRIEALEGAGLLAVGFRPDSLAVSSCFNLAGGANQSAIAYSMIVYVAEERSVVVVLAGKQMIFSSSILVGARSLNQKIVDEMAKGMPKAPDKTKLLEQIKQVGLDVSQEMGKRNVEASREVIKEMAQEIKSALNYFESKDGGQEITSIYLTGTNLKGMDAVLGTELGRQLKEEGELTGYGLVQGRLTMPRPQISEYVVALGNALKGI